MRRKQIIRGSLAAALVALALTGAAQAATINVTIGNNFFNPEAPPPIDVGDMVVWTNPVTRIHRVDFPDFTSGPMSQNETFEHVFGEAGTFPYICSLHNGMDGTITVTAPPGTVPALRISNAAVREGNRGARPMRFTVTLSEPVSNAVSFRLRTVEGTARAPRDYAARNVIVTLQAGVTRRVVTVWVRGDRRDERRERFTVRLSQPVGAQFGDATGLGTIRDNDP